MVAMLGPALAGMECLNIRLKTFHLALPLPCSLRYSSRGPRQIGPPEPPNSQGKKAPLPGDKAHVAQG